MDDDRVIKVRLTGGHAESLELGELHLIIAQRGPQTNTRVLLQAVELVSPAEIATGTPRPVQHIRTLLTAALERIGREEA